MQEKATKKAKELEEKMKNASAVRERELKEAEKEITASKKRMEASSKKAREMVQVRFPRRHGGSHWHLIQISSEAGLMIVERRLAKT